MKRFFRAAVLCALACCFGASASLALTDAPPERHPWGLAVVQDMGAAQVRVPILMYHQLDMTENSDYVVSAKLFEQQLRALKRAGYHAVSLADLRSFVYCGKKLPTNPIVITFDDGYASNFKIGLPILQKLDMKATVFMVGSSVGKDTYKDTAVLILPHFSYDEAKKMLQSGVFEIQSHTFDLHQSAELEGEGARDTMAQQPNESDEAYLALVREDARRFREECGQRLQTEVFALSYPQGVYNVLSEQALAQEGITITLTTQGGVNTLTRSYIESLRKLKRCHVSGSMTPEHLLDWIGDPSQS